MVRTKGQEEIALPIGTTAITDYSKEGKTVHTPEQYGMTLPDAISADTDHTEATDGAHP